MKPIEGYDQINEAGEFKRIPAGIYGVRITKTNDVADKEYLEVFCDVTKGEYANYFTNLVNAGLKDTSRFIRSYTMKALPFFKAFMTAIEKSNPGYKWDWREEGLIGKGAIAVIGEEEYIDNDGVVKVSSRIVEFRSVEAFKENRITVPPLKKVTEEDWKKWRESHPSLQTESRNLESIDISDDELPF